MSLVNRLPDHTVKVATGSGCLFRPMTDEYSYVLTAKHVVINESQPIKIVRQVIINEVVTNQALEIIGTPFYHPDPNKDAAIIKVKNIDIGNDLLRVEELFANFEGYYLSGHPDVRTGEQYSFRSNSISELSNPKEHGYIEAVLGKTASHSEIVGQSGGGIIKVENDRLLLAGIQKKMSVSDEEMLGRIDFMPLSFYDEIINNNKAELAPLLPYYLKCFSFLQEQVMKLDGCFVENNVAYTRNYLKNLTNSIIASDLTPLFIKNYFNEKLLIHNHNPDTILEKGLWIGWLEFLIIMNITKGFSPSSAQIG